MNKQFPNLTKEEIERIQTDAAYSGVKDGGYACMQKLNREREQGGTDRQVIQHAERNPILRQVLEQEKERLLHDFAYSGFKVDQALIDKILADKITGRK